MLDRGLRWRELEIDFRGDLHLARRICLAGDPPERTRADARVRASELDIVQRVEAFYTELQMARLSQFGAYTLITRAAVPRV